MMARVFLAEHGRWNFWHAVQSDQHLAR